MPESQLETLRAYSEGRCGTRQAIERAGLDGFADLLIALVKADLPLPKPSDTPERRANVERARAILQPRLRDHGD